jgi:dipeptide/tripeptide permease
MINQYLPIGVVFLVVVLAHMTYEHKCTPKTKDVNNSVKLGLVSVVVSIIFLCMQSSEQILKEPFKD